MALPPAAVVPWCASASTPRAKPLTIVRPRFARSRARRSVICVPYAVGRQVPTMLNIGWFRICASPRTPGVMVMASQPGEGSFQLHRLEPMTILTDL